MLDIHFLDNRIYFNFCHHSIGYIATILGYVTIFLGFDLALFDLDFSTTQLFAATVTIISAFSIVLELYKAKLENYSFFNVKLYSILSLLYFIFLFIMTVVVLSRISTFMPTSWFSWKNISRKKRNLLYEFVQKLSSCLA